MFLTTREIILLHNTREACLLAVLMIFAFSRKLTTQTSVMNGTLDAENMDVDRVCDAGGTVDDNDDSGPSPSR